VFENINFDDLFGGSPEPQPEPIQPTAPLAIVPETTAATSIVLAPVTTILGGGF